MSEPEVPTPPPISPYLTVHDARAAITFYEAAFGAELRSRQDTPDGKKVIHAALALNGGLVMLSDDFPEYSEGKSRTPLAIGDSPVTIHLDLPNVDEAFARALAAGARVEMPLGDMFWGDRYGVVVDPFGHRWSLATRKYVASRAQIEAAAKEHFSES